MSILSAFRRKFSSQVQPEQISPSHQNIEPAKPQADEELEPELDDGWFVPLGQTPHQHAAIVAMDFVRWVHTTQRPLVAPSAKVVGELRAYCHEQDVFRPRDRTFLTALKRVPGIRVVADRRIYASDGMPMDAKTTVYVFPAAGSERPQYPQYRLVDRDGTIDAVILTPR